MLDTLLSTLTDAPAWLWEITIIGGIVFAAVFNIPARKKFLSRESNTRKMALRYDALNFVLFYITFVASSNLVFGMENGDFSPFILNSAAFLVYSVSFWAVLQVYLYWKDKAT